MVETSMNICFLFGKTEKHGQCPKQVIKQIIEKNKEIKVNIKPKKTPGKYLINRCFKRWWNMIIYFRNINVQYITAIINNLINGIILFRLLEGINLPITNPIATIIKNNNFALIRWFMNFNNIFLNDQISAKYPWQKTFNTGNQLPKLYPYFRFSHLLVTSFRLHLLPKKHFHFSNLLISYVPDLISIDIISLNIKDIYN